MTTHDMSYLDEIKGWSAHYLAGEAGVSGPTALDSHGARMLIELRDEVVDAWEAGRFEWDSTRLDSDLCSELAGDTLTRESYPVFSAWAELCVWSNGWPDVAESTPGTWTFTGPVEDMVRDSLEDMLCAYAATLVRGIREAFGTWVCPQCGDTGNPRVCYPGDCRGTDEEKADWQGAYAVQVPAEGMVPALGIHPRHTEPYPLSVAPEAVSDPILILIAEAEAKPSDTQAFMVKMSAQNVAEFGERKIKRANVLACIAIVMGLVVIITSVAGVL